MISFNRSKAMQSRVQSKTIQSFNRGKIILFAVICNDSYAGYMKGGGNSSSLTDATSDRDKFIEYRDQLLGAGFLSYCHVLWAPYGNYPNDVPIWHDDVQLPPEVVTVRGYYTPIIGNSNWKVQLQDFFPDARTEAEDYHDSGSISKQYLVWDNSGSMRYDPDIDDSNYSENPSTFLAVNPEPPPASAIVPSFSFVSPEFWLRVVQLEMKAILDSL